MSTTKHTVYGTIFTILSTELNSIANAANTALSAEIDNSTNAELYIDLDLNTTNSFGGTRVAGSIIAVYRILALDGTTYPTTDETGATLIAAFAFTGASGAFHPDVSSDIPIPPGKYKLFARNLTTQTMPSSGSTLKGRIHSVATA